MTIEPVTRRKMRSNLGRGYCGVGVYHPKTAMNVGTLWRSSFAFGADFIFSIGPRFPERAWTNIVHADPTLGQATDTTCTHRHIPCLRFEDVAHMRQTVPLVDIVAVELSDRAVDLRDFRHPDRAIYLLGAEDYGIPAEVIDECAAVVQIPTFYCLNVAAAGTVVLYDRAAKRGAR